MHLPGLRYGPHSKISSQFLLATAMRTSPANQAVNLLGWFFGTFTFPLQSGKRTQPRNGPKRPRRSTSQPSEQVGQDCWVAPQLEHVISLCAVSRNGSPVPHSGHAGIRLPQSFTCSHLYHPGPSFPGM